MSQTDQSQFGWIRSFFWPIQQSELPKIIPMILMLFLICLNYSILRPMKDAVVVTASGAKVLPIIKVFAILPMAVLATYIFTKLANRYSQEKVFYFVVSGFLVFFALYGLVLFPYEDSLKPQKFAMYLTHLFPSNGFFLGVIAMVEHWVFTGFYVMAELWSTMVMQVLFWGFANEITTVSQSRRFYAVLAVVSNFAAMIAGLGGEMLSAEQVTQSQEMLLTVIVLSGIFAMAVFRWMNKRVLNAPEFDELHKTKRELKPKKKLSVRESLSFLSKSRYLLCIAVLVVSYNLTINLVEVVWKDKLKELYSSSQELQQCLFRVTFYVGFFSTIVSFFLPRFISRFGWTTVAMITPTILVTTSIGFFTFLFFEDSLGEVAMTLFGTTPLVLVAFFGGAQNVLSKASKYSVFDATKEMAFIPLDHESKLKGKAAIDGVGSRFGKSGGSFIHSGLLMVFTSVSQSAPIIASALTAVIGFWMVAVRSLGKQFNELTGKERQEHIQENIQDQLALQQNATKS